MRGKRILRLTLSLVTIIILSAGVYINSLMPIITGYAAKNLCSDVFVSGRKPADVEANDLKFSFIKYTSNLVDFNERSVTSSFLWGKSKAIYRVGFGATLIKDSPEVTLRQIKFPAIKNPCYKQDSTRWPLGNIIPDTTTGIDKAALAVISAKLINDNSYNGDAFAFMVLHKGIPVAEKYKPQFDSHTRFLSWSMAKSFTNAMIGILSKQGKLDINKADLLEQWKNDERNKITLNDMMHMQSGLKWNEDYGNRSDVTLMLHCESDMARFAYEKPAAFPAGTRWYYSSGTTNIVSYIIRRQFASDSLYYKFAYDELFNKTGMPDVIWETDPTGTRVGSSYLYATARDYARFALLYQNDGVFNGERILPEGWVKYSTTPASGSKGLYGAFFWLNSSKSRPSAPADMYSCEGHDGQMIFILPTQQLIVVVLGFSHKPDHEMDFERLLKDVLATVK